MPERGASLQLAEGVGNELSGYYPFDLLVLRGKALLGRFEGY